jgi:TolA-binding protein
MKRFVPLLFVAAWLVVGPIAGHAQNDAEEIRRLNATTEALVEGQESLRSQLQTLHQEVAQLRAENSALKQQLAGVGQDNVSRSELQKVVVQVREVDSKRQADAQLVQRQLKDIAEMVSKPIPVPEPLRRPKLDEPPVTEKKDPLKIDHQPALPTEGYEHVVQTGESLGLILSAYNQKYQLKVKPADVLRANPKLRDPKKIFVGQKLWIPEIK